MKSKPNKTIAELRNLLAHSTPNKNFTWQRRWGMIPPKALEHIGKIEAENSDLLIKATNLLADKNELKAENASLKQTAKDCYKSCEDLKELRELLIRKDKWLTESQGLKRYEKLKETISQGVKRIRSGCRQS